MTAVVSWACFVAAAVPDPQPPAAPASTSVETVVTARPDPPATPRADQTATATVILPDDSPRAYDDLGSLMLEVPGATVTRTGSIGAFSTITLRGSNPDQVRIYLDGVPVNIASGGGVDISTLPIGDVERVEIYRGTSPLVFGESALGGIISITTRTPGFTRANARAGMGSFGTAFGDVTGGGRVGRLRLYAGLHGFSSRGDFTYNNDNGTAFDPSDDSYIRRPNADVRQGDGIVRAALTLAGRRTLGLALVAFGRDQGMAGLLNIPTMRARFQTGRGLAYLRYESRDDLGPGGRLSAVAYVSAQYDRMDDATGEAGSMLRTRNSTRTVGADIYGTRPFGEWLRVATVLQGRHEMYEPVNELAAVPVGVPARRTTGVAGAELDLRWRALDINFIPSARLEAMNDTVSRRDIVGVPLPAEAVSRVLPVFRFGILRPLGESATMRAVIKGNVGRYARAPSFLELYGNGTIFILGNSDLLPERGTNADLGLWLDRFGERVSVTSRSTLFGAQVDDLIQWQHAPWGQSRADNLARARIWGAEQELRLAIGRRVRLTGQFTYMPAIDKSDNVTTNGKQIPFHPIYRSYARPEIVHVPLPLGLELAAYVDGEFRAKNYADGANVQNLHPRLLVGCGLTVAWPRGHLRVTASGVNLTDSRQVDVANWALPGRTAFLTLAYSPVGSTDEMGSGVFNPHYGP